MRGARRVCIPYMRSCSEIRVYWGQIGIMEKEMETTIVFVVYRDKGKENGNYYIIWVSSGESVQTGNATAWPHVMWTWFVSLNQGSGRNPQP